MIQLEDILHLPEIPRTREDRCKEDGRCIDFEAYETAEIVMQPHLRKEGYDKIEYYVAGRWDTEGLPFTKGEEPEPTLIMALDIDESTNILIDPMEYRISCFESYRTIKRM